MAKSQDLKKKFRETNFISYMENQGMTFDSEISKGEVVKLCSSDDFKDVADEFEMKYGCDRAPVMIGHVGGFYVTASLLGAAENNCVSKPYILFFDRKMANVENAIFNTLLMRTCESKEEYIIKLFGLSIIDVVKALKPSLYTTYIEKVLAEDESFNKLNSKDRKEALKSLYKQKATEVDSKIAECLERAPRIKQFIIEEFNLDKLRRYAESMEYNPLKHAILLSDHAKGKLGKKEKELFAKLLSHMTEYLDRGDNYKDLLRYLSEDIKKNGSRHILANDAIFAGYKNLFTGRGSYVKFVSGIDISNQKGVKKLEEVLRRDGFISDSLTGMKFPIDLAFIPHIDLVKDAYPFLKKYVQDYISLYKNNPRNKSFFVTNSTVDLDIRTLHSIGGDFIKAERDRWRPYQNLSKVESRNGLPWLGYMGTAPYGNIYHSEPDTNNMINMAIAMGAHTLTITGMIYATYFRDRTSCRLITDPTYETLEERLQAAKAKVEELNRAGVRVEYKMGEEEYQLYKDIHRMYLREQGIKKDNFLDRDDLKSKYDWVRPIIIQDLIPYMIRSGEDVINMYTDDETKTCITKVIQEIKRRKENSSYLGSNVRLKPEYLENTDMFHVAYEEVLEYSEEDTVNLISSIGRTSKGKNSVMKNLNFYRAKVLREGGKVPQLFIDSEQPFMSVVNEGDTVTINVTPMINDEYFMHPKLLAGVKSLTKEDKTYKRMNQAVATPNSIGGCFITGRPEEIMDIIPYYKRTKEVMEEVQHTGVGYKKNVIGRINDTHFGALSERPEEFVKFIDYLFYKYNPTGIVFNGDFQTGYNFAAFPNESRHVGAISMTQQVIGGVKLMKPYLKNAFGTVKGEFDSIDSPDKKSLSNKIMNHLLVTGLIETVETEYGFVTRIKRGVDYKRVDLKLPRELEEYEKAIRKKLANIVNLEFVDILEGNHERNSDWNYKGYNELELLRQTLEGIKEATGSDADITLTEFFINNKGGIVNAPYCFRKINGYNTLTSHCFQKSGTAPTVGISKWLVKMAPNLPRVDIVNSAHFHRFEATVINDTLITIDGSGAGQSGYEQNLGLSSQTLFTIQIFLEDGRVMIETVGPEFLKQWQIKNPYVKAMGLENFIQSCMTEEATIFGEDTPQDIQKVYTRQIVPRKPNKEIK